MKSKLAGLIVAILVIGMPLSAVAAPGDLASEVRLLVTAVAAPSILAGPDFIRTAPVAAAAFPALASPASPSPVLPLAVQRPFRDMFRSDKTERALFNSTLLAMAAINVADYLSTKQALKIPGSYESNPLMKPFVKNEFAFAAIKAGTTAVTYFGMKKLFKRNKTMAWVMTTAVSFVTSYAVYNNLRLVQKFRAR